LTGTPVENHLGELWSQFDFVMPGLLGDRVTFARHIRTPIEKYKDSERLAALRSRIRPFRRTKAQVLDELPEKSVIIKHVNLCNRQLDLYETVRAACDEQIRKEIARSGFKKCQLIILDAMLKLRQACCDPRILAMPSARDVEESAKLETLLEMVEQLASEGRKMLVFSQFTSMLDLIASELEQRELPYVELRGDTKRSAQPGAAISGVGSACVPCEPEGGRCGA
jgi:SNF2 family DNA or RNA helicase